MTDVTCPTCGTVAQFDDVSRDAQAFCRVCDYPLFWIRTASTGEGEGGLDGDPGLRRLPGTAGLVAIATLACWNCDEPNPITGEICIRCGAKLHPDPVLAEPPPVIPAPLPEPPPPPKKKPLIPPEWIPALVVAALLFIWCVVGAIVALLH